MRAYILSETGEVVNVIEIDENDDPANYGAVMLDKFAPVGYSVANGVVTSPDGYNVYTEEEAEAVRSKRNDALISTDGIVTSYLEKGVAVPQELLDYRQALRDIPLQDGFPAFVDWPLAP